MKFIKPLNEKKPKGAPDFHHSDAPDAEGRFRDLGIKDLAAWLIKTRKKDVKKISGSLTQQVVFNRNDDPEYAEKMEKVRKEVYKQLGREDLLDKMDESYNEFFYLEFKKWAHKNRAKINRMSDEEKIEYLENNYHSQFGKKHWKDDDLTNVGIELHDQLVKDRIIKESIDGLDNAKFRLEDVYQHLGIEHGSTRRGDKYVQINYIPVSRPQSQQPEFVKVFYDNDKDLKKIGKELGMDLKESVNEAKFPGRKGDFIKWKDGYYDIKKTSGSTAYVKFPHTASSAFSQVWDDEVTLSDEKHRGKKVFILESNVINEEDSYNDYPAAAKKNAQMAIDWKEKYGRDEVPAGTPVGWARAHQLAKGEKISADTVKRMSAFNRHRKNSSIAPEHKDEPWKDNGYVAWLIWGGDEGVDWAIEKSKEIDAMKESKQMKYIKPLHEAKRGAIHKAAKKGSYPVSIVVINSGMVVKQELVDTPAAVPAVFNELQKEYPNAIISVESKTGETLFSESVVNEGYWSHYEYEKWTKENGKPKYPKWVKTTLKEIVKGGFMEPHYDAEHNYMVLWLGSLENKRRSELYAYDKKGKKEFGKVGYAMYQRFYNDLTGYNMFFMMGAMYALEVSKQIQDKIANGEPVEPAYYLMKEYFNNFGMDTKRSRIFNAAYEKLEKWMKDNNIETL